MDETVYLLGVTALTGLTILAWASSGSGRAGGPYPYGLLAYARGGRHAVTQSVLAVLHAHGFVEPWQDGMVISTEECAKAPMSEDPVERAIRAALVAGPAGPRLLAARPQVLRALDGLRTAGVAAGLLRAGWVVVLQRTAAGVVVMWSAVAALFFEPRLAIVEYVSGTAAGLVLLALPRRTHAGREAVAAARMDCALPTPAHTGSHPLKALPPTVVGVAVAIYGSAALLAIMPRFARDAGLFDRHSASDTLGDAPLTMPSYYRGL